MLVYCLQQQFKMLKLYLTSIFFLLKLLNVNSALVLDSVFVVLRHGDRNPLHIYPNDKYNKEYWNQHGGLGNMTNKGENRIRVAANNYRQQYEMLLNKSHELSNQIITSTSVRAIKTADIFMEVINETVKFERNDKMLSSSSVCKKAKKIQDDLLLQKATELMPNKTFIDNLSKKTGEKYTDDTLKNLRLLTDLADTLKIERDQMKLNVSDWITDKETANILSELEKKSFAAMTNDQELQRLRAGLLLKNILDQMENNSSQRFFLYSTHDYNQIVLLQALNLYDQLDNNSVPPTYVSGVVLEVYRNESDKQQNKSIRFIYRQFLDDENGTIIKVDTQMVPELCQTELQFHDGTAINTQKFCTWEQFSNELLKNLIPENWDKECMISGAMKPVITFMVFIITILTTYFLTN
uniref:acid phosphatase n=1 Tax=Dermatophagoides pteronyssinus TaxID=6956 RepID=A0A6P6XWI2_DERPT|nr:prostatic acid phosphatase-like [Dermatophagoides pteronyssinus]